MLRRQLVQVIAARHGNNGHSEARGSAQGCRKQTNTEIHKETDQQDTGDTAGRARQEHEGQAACGTSVGVSLQGQPESAAQVQEPSGKRKRTRTGEEESKETPIRRLEVQVQCPRNNVAFARDGLY